MVQERLKRAWQQWGRSRKNRGDRLPVPPEGAGQPLPGVPEFVLDQWPTWVTRWDAARHTVAAEPQRAQDFLETLLGSAVVPFLDEVERASDEQWTAVQQAVSRWWSQADAHTRGRIDVVSRTKVWLAAQGRRSDLATFCASRWFEHGWIPTEVSHGRVHAVFPAAGAVPADVLELGPGQTALTAHVRGLVSTDDGWELELFVSLDNVSLAPDTTIEVWLGEQVLPLVQRRDPRANHGDVDGQRYQDASWGAATVCLGSAASGELTIRLSSNGVTRVGSLTHVDRRGTARQGSGRTFGPGGRCLELNEARQLQVVEVAPWPASDRAVLLDSFSLDAADLVVRGRWHGERPPDTEFWLACVDRRTADPVPVQPTVTPEGFEVRLPLAETRGGRDHQPLVPGRYWVQARSGSLDLPVLLSEPANHAVLDWQTGPGDPTRAHQVRWVSEGPERSAGVMLRNALAADERGPFHQWRLQRQALGATDPIEQELVYLQVFQGATASDSQRALRDEIVRTRPDLRVVWGVADASAWTPPGDERVLLHSAAWYRTLSTAHYLSQNGDVDRWFRARSGQRFLATFHGYPSKSMGIGMWKGKGYTPLRIAHELERTRDVWSLIITPDPSMDEYYRTEYDYSGPILARGLPRDDMLRGPDVTTTRQRTRDLLGIAEGEIAVLYAPTWRDDKALDWRQAEAVLHLDIARASQALGPEYVFLMRGHRFTSTGQLEGTPRMIEVTEHPEINDLILAADAAVLDYSSLRFDFSLTGRPMVFLTPDLAEYTGSVRGFLYDYPSTAPGPLVDGVDEVVAALADLSALRRQYAAQYEAFETRFNRFMDGHAAERVAEAWLV